VTLNDSYGNFIRTVCVKQFISITGNIRKWPYICWNQEFLGFGLQVKPSNSVVLVTIIKFTITVTNSIACKVEQAKIVGPLARRTSDDIILNFENEIKVITGNPSSKLTGCSILYNGEILFSEHNLHHNTDSVTLNDSYGNFIRTVWEISRGFCARRVKQFISVTGNI
jgi:hypothetical protein